MSKILVETKKPTNLKPDSWYNEFYGDWIGEFYSGLPSLEECIQFQKDYDKNIDNNQLETQKIYRYDCKEFIIKNNTFEKNRELLIRYEQQQLSHEVEGEERDLKLQKLFNKCFEVLEQGYLITSQLFIFYVWYDEKFQYNDYDKNSFEYKVK